MTEPQETPAPQVDMTGEMMFESLTGYDELAVAKAFGGEIQDLANARPTMFLRAMVFVHRTREGDNVTEAKDRAMGMSLKACNDYFADVPDETEPDDPVTDVGKDSSLVA